MTKFNIQDALIFLSKINFNCDEHGIDVNDVMKGMNIELEHGYKFKNFGINVTNNDPDISGKIALAHLLEFPDYYQRLKIMEAKASLSKKKYKFVKKI